MITADIVIAGAGFAGAATANTNEDFLNLFQVILIRDDELELERIVIKPFPYNLRTEAFFLVFLRSQTKKIK